MPLYEKRATKLIFDHEVYFKVMSEIGPILKILRKYFGILRNVRRFTKIS